MNQQTTTTLQSILKEFFFICDIECHIETLTDLCMADLGAYRKDNKAKDPLVVICDEVFGANLILKLYIDLERYFITAKHVIPEHLNVYMAMSGLTIDNVFDLISRSIQCLIAKDTTNICESINYVSESTSIFLLLENLLKACDTLNNKFQTI